MFNTIIRRTIWLRVRMPLRVQLPRFRTRMREGKLLTPLWGKESACNAGDLGSTPGLGRSPGEGNSYPLQYSGLENSMDCIVHGVAKSGTTEQVIFGCSGLRCCAQAFSGCSEQGLLSLCRVRASRCRSFSCWEARAQYLWCRGLVAP